MWSGLKIVSPIVFVCTFVYNCGSVLFSQCDHCVWFPFFIVETGTASFQGLGREYIWEQSRKAVCDSGRMDSKGTSATLGTSVIFDESWSLQSSPSKIDCRSPGSLESYQSLQRNLKFKESELTGSGEDKGEWPTWLWKVMVFEGDVGCESISYSLIYESRALQCYLFIK